MADIILRRVQSFQAAFGFVIVALDVDHHPRRPRIIGHEHGRNADQSDARICQLTLEDRLDLFADGLAQPVPVILLATTFHIFPGGKPFRIAEREKSGDGPEVTDHASQRKPCPSKRTVILREAKDLLSLRMEESGSFASLRMTVSISAIGSVVGKVWSVVFNKRIRNLGSEIVGDSGGSALHILHQAVNVIAGM